MKIYIAPLFKSKKVLIEEIVDLDIEKYTNNNNNIVKKRCLEKNIYYDSSNEAIRNHKNDRETLSHLFSLLNSKKY